MNGNYVITIGREFGSGGREIGRILAEKLNIKCYDKELLALSAKESGLSEELFKFNDEKPTNSFLYSLVMDTYSMGYSGSSYMDVPMNQKIFMAQYECIKKLAEQESCIIVGRCADYALKDMPGLVSVFISADMDFKIKRVIEMYGCGEDKAKDIINKTNKKRASYYNFYSNKKWADSRSYNLCINSSVVGIENAADLIIQFMNLKLNKKD